MAKGGGSTRLRSWRDAIQDKVPATKRVEFIASHIDKYWEPDMDAVMAFDSLSDPERNQLLEKINFSGVVWNDEFYGDGGSLSISRKIEKDRMFGMLDDYAYYNDPDGDSTFTVGYSDGTIRRYEDGDERAKRRIKRSDAVFVFAGGISAGDYWATERGYEAMDKIANFSVWKNGKKVR